MKNYLVLAFIIVAIAAITALRGERNAAAASVDTVSVTPMTIYSSVIASGSLAFRNEVQLTSEVIAKVTEVTVEEGDEVREGEVLMRLDQEQFQANVDQREASVRIQQIAIERQQQQLANLESRWERQKSLWDAELIQEEEFETIDHRLNIAKLELASQREALLQSQAQLVEARNYLDKTVIRAPISGRVITLDIKAGETVISGTTNILGSAMMTIANTSDIITEVFVDEADIAALRIGQGATVYAVAFPDTPIAGTVESISATARTYPGRQGLSFKVKVRLDDIEGIELFSGMSCRAEIFQAAGEPILAVPIESVVTDIEGEKNTHYVYVVEAGTAHKVEVQLGPSSDDWQGITEGLSADQIVVSGPFRTIQLLSDQAPVSIKANSDTLP